MSCELVSSPLLHPPPYPSPSSSSSSCDLQPPGDRHYDMTVARRHSGGSSDSGGGSGMKPDGDAIKMFVGQIPKSWEEDQLREMFREYGEVHELNILRDRSSGHSRGCCFVTYYTRKAALDAQNALHNIKTLPAMHHPVQMKPADTEGKNVEERKLFIGMIPKHYNEDDVRSMFIMYGTIEDCKILRETKDAKTRGKSKGCAFITYTKRSSCIQAIKAMNNQRTLEGCSAPLVVKFADTQKDKEKRLKLVEELTKSGGPVSPELLQACKDLLMQHCTTVYPSMRNTTDPAHPQLLSLLPPNHHQVTKAIGLHPAALHGIAAYATDMSGNLISTTIPGLTPHHSIGAYNCHMMAPGHAATSTETMSQAYAGLQQYTAQLPHFIPPSTGTQPVNGLCSSLGPDGSNLFIYHLPQEFSDNDLIQMFAPFGTIISARVFIDKQTNMSKCFGFVSYDNVPSAHQAIQAMNGFQVGTKRLKVQLKRSKADNKPY